MRASSGVHGAFPYPQVGDSRTALSPAPGEAQIRPVPERRAVRPDLHSPIGRLRGHSGTLAQARFARIASVTEARLEDAGSGLAPATEGWFVVEQGEPA